MIEQNTPDWYQARCGSLGASAVHDALVDALGIEEDTP